MDATTTRTKRRRRQASEPATTRQLSLLTTLTRTLYAGRAEEFGGEIPAGTWVRVVTEGKLGNHFEVSRPGYDERITVSIWELDLSLMTWPREDELNFVINRNLALWQAEQDYPALRNIIARRRARCRLQAGHQQISGYNSQLVIFNAGGLIQ